MQFNFISPKRATETVITTFAGRQRRSPGAEPIMRGPDVAAAAEQRWPKNSAAPMMAADWSNLEQLSSKRRMTVLTDELERQTKAQSQFEESFFKLAVRLRETGELSNLTSIRGETKKNLVLRRLSTEADRLRDLMSDMGEAIERMNLIAMHMKVIRFAPTEEALQTGRNECVVAIEDFVARAEQCVRDVRDMHDMIGEQLAKLAPPPPPEPQDGDLLD